jgi:aconitate hydratase
VAGRQTAPQVSFDVNPTSRQILTDLTKMGATANLVIGGARIHQSGCMGCIGMGQAPAVGRNSLRTMPRNFPGRSGTKEDAVWLCSPETAAASALTGVITDPRDWAREEKMDYPELDLPEHHSVNTAMLVAPLPGEEARKIQPVKGPNISDLPELDPLPDEIEAPVLLKVGDNVSTDEISPAGARALPFRSNIPKLAEFSFTQIDESYPDRAREAGDSGHIVVGGENYGQGSSREHAAIAPRHLGLRVVIAKSFARIHWQNLANFGVLALEFDNGEDYAGIDQDDTLHIADLRDALEGKDTIQVDNVTKETSFMARHRLSPRQVKDVLAGGLIPRLADEEK